VILLVIQAKPALPVLTFFNTFGVRFGVRFHAGKTSAGKKERYLLRGSVGWEPSGLKLPHGCCQTLRRWFQWKPKAQWSAWLC